MHRSKYIFMMIVITLFLVQTSKPQWIKMKAFEIAEFKSIVCTEGHTVACINNKGPIDSVFVSTDRGESWIPAQSGLEKTFIGWHVFDFAVKDSIIFAGTFLGVFKTTNFGADWIKTSSGLMSQEIYELEITGDTIYAGADSSKMYMSANLGRDWKFFKQFFAMEKAGVMGIQISHNYFFVFLIYYAPSELNQIFRSDNGIDWMAIKYPISNQRSRGIFTFGSTIFFSTLYDGLYISKDYGDNWQSSNKGLDGRAVYKFDTDGRNLFAGSVDLKTRMDSMSLSTDGGVNWMDISSQFDNKTGILCMTHDEKYLYVGTRWNGLWRRPLSEVVSVSDNHTRLPSQFELQQNFPNPFTRNTTVQYSIPTHQPVTLNLYDALGRLVKTIVSEEKDAGTYTAEINASALRAGMYFYALESAATKITKGCSIVK